MCSRDFRWLKESCCWMAHVPRFNLRVGSARLPEPEGGGNAMSDLLTHDTLVFKQKAKLIELTNEYKVLDQEGNVVGLIREEGQSTARKALRILTKVDQFLT